MCRIDAPPDLLIGLDGRWDCLSAIEELTLEAFALYDQCMFYLEKLGHGFTAIPQLQQVLGQWPN